MFSKYEGFSMLHDYFMDQCMIKNIAKDIANVQHDKFYLY